MISDFRIIFDQKPLYEAYIYKKKQMVNKNNEVLLPHHLFTPSFIQILSISLLIGVLHACSSNKKDVYLDQMEFHKIINPYGAPKRNTSFTGYRMNINGNKFDRGLGMNAPAKLNIDLDGKAIEFSTVIGIDSSKYYYHNEAALDSTIRNRKRWIFPADYVYDNKADHNNFTKGGTALLKILTDGKEVFNSGLITADMDPQIVKLSLQHVNTLSVVVEPTDDGSFTDFVNLANARIVAKDKNLNPVLYYQPDDILVNHVGFHPKAPKTCYKAGAQSVDFKVIKSLDGQPVFKGKMTPVSGDLGNYLVGDFTEITAPGTYFIKVGSQKTKPFRIDDEVLQDCLKGHMHFVSQQRSGHPAVGWNPNQHLDDGVREDNGEFQDVSGGWYDACDVRKPTNTNATLLFAIMHLALDEPAFFDKEYLAEEIKWGNKFLLAMQEPNGSIMKSLAFGDYKKSDNKWTDNIQGNEDDRKIQTDAERVGGQLYFVNAELLVARYFKIIDPEYSEKCQQAAEKCLDWIMKKDTFYRITQYSFLTLAGCELYQKYGTKKYKQIADKGVDLLFSCKESDPAIPFTIFGKESRWGWHSSGSEHIVKALSTYAETFPESDKTSMCEATIKDYIQQFYVQLSDRNAFHLMPWHVSKDPEHSKKQIGEFYYRNLLHVGLNRSIAMKGYNVLLAGKDTQDKDLIKRAQQQIDWIFGANPFNASYIIGFGHNQPALFEAGNDAYEPPHTPQIKGGTMTGICADKDDNPTLYPGWWWSTEYWIPTTAAIILLENELNNYYNNQ